MGGFSRLETEGLLFYPGRLLEHCLVVLVEIFVFSCWKEVSSMFFFLPGNVRGYLHVVEGLVCTLACCRATLSNV